MASELQYSGFTISSPDWHLRIALDHVSKVMER